MVRIDHDVPVEPGQTFVVDRFRTEDARGVAHLFYAEYGPSYPIETFYFPERIIAENENGNIHSVVARTPKGDIIGHGALFRSSPHFQNLYEIGQCIIRPDYRVTFAAYNINKFAAETLTAITHPDGIFGEAVTHITATQKFSALVGMKDVALEMDLMPSEAYEKSQSASGRVSCLILFKSFRDRPQEIFIPSRYAEIMEYILRDVEITRTLTPSAGEFPDNAKSLMSSRFFKYAGVGRFNIVSAGEDFEEIVDSLEKEGQENETLVFQFFLNMSEPWLGEAVEILRKRRYFFGGCVPRWFDTDGMLMQKILSPPDFAAPRLYSAKARQLLDFLRSDWQDPQG
ncbi:MAG TPA: hypothetical protein DCZ69_18995 [Syntrophobacteraceae bacterium]|nr:hypothetical protein [Syntrophobacteraceae bacterium]HBD10341.1 hypothetical protein [Syntrophobacteraceae bacterium]HBZ57449.1 hypothetical protein [Syntrophobacteraceae bacterium]